MTQVHAGSHVTGTAMVCNIICAFVVLCPGSCLHWDPGSGFCPVVRSPVKNTSHDRDHAALFRTIPLQDLPHILPGKDLIAGMAVIDIPCGEVGSGGERS